MRSTRIALICCFMSWPWLSVPRKASTYASTISTRPAFPSLATMCPRPMSTPLPLPSVPPKTTDAKGVTPPRLLDLRGAGRVSDRAGRKAFHHTVPEPREADPPVRHPASGSTLAQQARNQRTLLVSNDRVFGSGNKLAVARFRLMVLFAMAGMTSFLVPVRSTLWACVSDDDGFCWPLCFRV